MLRDRERDRRSIKLRIAFGAASRTGSPVLAIKLRGAEGAAARASKAGPLRSLAAKQGADTSEREVVCVACGHRITDEDHRIEMSGAHAHTFVNPAGFGYVIGCWNAAAGCVHLGSTETAFSWFPGWSWQLAACASCRTHLGWVYRNAGQQFHGLIAERLRLRGT